MTIKQRMGAGFLVCAMMGLVAAGCSQGDPQGETEASVGASTPSSEALVLFRDPTESGPRLDVYEIDGHAAISVGGPIGTEAVLTSATATDSITDLYLAIHPGVAEVPAELVALSERLEPALAELRLQPHSSAPPVTVDKSQSSFNATVCKNFTEGSVKYIPMSCLWGGAVSSRNNFTWPLSITAGDRTYGWNANAANATMTWWHSNSQNLFVPVWSINLPAYWWTWMSIGSGGPYFAEIKLAYGTGELGLTHHDFRYTF
jgi:hypothetical protein